MAILTNTPIIPAISMSGSYRWIAILNGGRLRSGLAGQSAAVRLR